MTQSNKVKLAQEYTEKLYRTLRFLEFTGFNRFLIRNGKIVERNTSSAIYNIFVIIMLNVAAAIMIWTANVSEDLSAVEFGAIVHFSIFATLFLIYITFSNKSRGPTLIQNCIELDDFLGAEETRFMRNLTITFYKVVVVLVLGTQVVFVSYMYYIFHVSISIHVIGTTYFFWIFFAYDDFGFYLFLCLFLTTRARYLNVALLKATNMNMEDVPKQFMFHVLFWSKKYDNLITFHTRAQNKDFSIAFRMLIKQLRLMERCYRFPIALGVSTVIMGTFVTVQTFIMYIKASTIIMRASVITGWAVSTWFYILVVSLLNDSFYVQTELTKVICAFIQLKPSCSARIIKLTKDVLSTLALRDARISLYNLFIFDTGLVFKLAASTFVYITVQLQLAFPNLEDEQNMKNVTKFAMHELSRNEIKQMLFLF